MPLRLLRQWIDSEEFTLLLAYKRRNTLAPDTWFSAQAVALAAAGSPPDPFVPITVDRAAERRKKQAAFEAALDRETD